MVDLGGERLAARFRELGWSVTSHLVMAHRREPDRRVDSSMVREVSFDDLKPVRRAVTLRESWGDDRLGEMLSEVKRRIGSACELRHFAAVLGRNVAAYCELRSDGRTAQIEDVNTLDEFRGRGLARAVVQHALDIARRDHGLVFLEALAGDWPQQLYGKLGFDVVDTRHLFLRYPHPLTRLRLRTPRLELRLATRAELRELAEVARDGIHPPEEMPFAVAWTDNTASPSFVADFVAFHEQALRRSAPHDWRLELVAFLDGRPIGVQGVGAESFAAARTVSTGSWLGAPWQRQGLGTEMRAAALELAFAGLGAATARSGAVAGNDASLAVSRKLGYVADGLSSVAPRGKPVPHHDLHRSRAGWVSPVPVEMDGLDTVRSLLGA